MWCPERRARVPSWLGTLVAYRDRQSFSSLQPQPTGSLAQRAWAEIPTMFRAVFVAIILAHALIHLLGFVKAFGIAPLEQAVRTRVLC